MGRGGGVKEGGEREGGGRGGERDGAIICRNDCRICRNDCRKNICVCSNHCKIANMLGNNPQTESMLKSFLILIACFHGRYILAGQTSGGRGHSCMPCSHNCNHVHGLDHQFSS